MKDKESLFIIADCACDTGFATVTHNLIKQLHTQWDIHVLAINYYGDPHWITEYAKLYAPTAKVQGDLYGISRVNELITRIKPAALLMINDPWVAMQYQPVVLAWQDQQTQEKGWMQRVLYTPIDAENIKPAFITPLNDMFDHVVAYTHFGKKQLVLGGLTIPVSVISHGVDTTVFHPIDKLEARDKVNTPLDWYIVNVSDRNQIRKRIDLAFYYFAEWVKRTNKPDTVKLYYHGALKDQGWDLVQLADYMGIRDRLIITSPHLTASRGLPLEMMSTMYSVADVGFSTTSGEGFGLTTMERMACKVAMIVPKYSALGEWPYGAVYYMDISPTPYFNIGGLNTKTGIPDMESAIAALETMYTNPKLRAQIAQKGYDKVTQEQYQWSYIAQQFHHILSGERKDEQ